MKLNSYKRTPGRNAPKWIKVSLVALLLFHALLVLFAGVIISIDQNSIIPFVLLFAFVSIFALLIIAGVYNEKRAYFEVEGDNITAVDYLLFKRRERTLSLCEIKKIKCVYGSGIGQPPRLVLKNSKNKTLLRVFDFPEIRTCFENLGLKVE